MAKKIKKKKRLVLDVGASAIRLCELTPTKEGYQLTKYFQRETLFDPALDEEEKQEKQLEVLTELLKEAKIACVPGAGFGADNNVRFSYATSMDDINAGLERIGAFVSGLS